MNEQTDLLQYQIINKMQTITKEFTSLSEAIQFVRILKKYSNIVKMKSKGNIYTYSFK